MEVNIMPDMGKFVAQGISAIVCLLVMGISIYAIVLMIKALRIYIKKNS